MKISGFSMCRNADILYYPIKESILSALPIVDEFVIAIGASDASDKTLELVRSIDSPKIKIVETIWDLETYKHGSVHAQQTDVAMKHCSGDWLLYLHAYEVIHEQDHAEIVAKCEAELTNKKVEGFVLNYYHFWGDYHHIRDSHSWYSKEVRIVRNHPNIHSWKSAQSFRYYEDFSLEKYLDRAGTRKLNVKQIDGHVYHYGWVRPPEKMTAKTNALDEIHSHAEKRVSKPFQYGNLSGLPKFNGTHPSVMEERIKDLGWDPMDGQSVEFMRHDKAKAKIISWVEKRVLGGRKIFTDRNYKMLR